MWYDNIHQSMKSLYPNAIVGIDWVWADYGNGPHMAKWNAEKLGPLNLENIELEANRLLLSLPVPQMISRRQCAKELFFRQMISGEEMVLMTTIGTPPAMIENIFSTLPQNEQWLARTDFASANYERNNFLLNNIMSATGATSSDIDQFFRDAYTH